MNKQILFYEAKIDLMLYLESLQKEDVDILMGNKNYFSNCSTLLDKFSRVNLLQSKQLCLAYLLCQFNPNKESSIKIFNEIEMRYDISRSCYWEVMKHLCLYEEMNMLHLKNCNEIVYQFCQEFFQYVISSPFNDKDKEVTAQLLKLSWTCMDKFASPFSTCMMKYLSETPRVFIDLCESLTSPEHRLILLVTILHLYGQSEESFTTIDTELEQLPEYLILEPKNKLELLGSIYESVVDKFQYRLFKNSSHFPSGAEDLRAALLCFMHLDKSVLDQDLISQLSESEKQLCIQSMLSGVNSLGYFVTRKQREDKSHLDSDQRDLKYFTKCLTHFIERNMKDLFINVTNHTDSIIWCLRKHLCLKELGLWYSQWSESFKGRGKSSVVLENDCDILTQSDKIFEFLLPLVGEFASLNVCQNLMRKIGKLQDRFVPVEKLYQLLKLSISYLPDTEKTELLSWWVNRGWGANIISPAGFKNRLQICLNRISNDSEHQSNEIILELYLLLLIDPEVTMNKLLRTAVETKGAFGSVIKCFSELSFSFGVYSLSCKPLLLAALDELLFGDSMTSLTSVQSPAAVTSSIQSNAEYCQRRDALLLQILAMPSSLPLVPTLIDRLISPHLESSDSQIHTTIHFLTILFNDKSDTVGHNFSSTLVNSLSSESLTSLIATLLQFAAIPMNVSELLGKLVILSIDRIDAKFLFQFLFSEGLSVRVHLLLHHLYKFSDEFVIVSSIYRGLFHEDVLLKHRIQISDDLIGNCQGPALLSALLEFASVSSTTLAVAIEAVMDNKALLNLKPFDITVAVIKIIPGLYPEEWERTVYYICHLVRIGSLFLPYIPMFSCVPLEDMREYRGHLNVLQLMIRVNDTMQSVQDSVSKQHATQNLFSALKLLTRPFIPNQSIMREAPLTHPVKSGATSTTAEFVRGEVISLLECYLVTCQRNSDRYQSIKLLQNELDHCVAQSNKEDLNQSELEENFDQNCDL